MGNYTVLTSLNIGLSLNGSKNGRVDTYLHINCKNKFKEKAF